MDNKIHVGPVQVEGRHRVGRRKRKVRLHFDGLETRLIILERTQRQARLCQRAGHPRGGVLTMRWWEKRPERTWMLLHRAACTRCGAALPYHGA